jgi:pimeloyl-ACP methyl ester carboxylesterase
MPTLIAWGSRDLTFLPWVARRLHAMIPHASFHLFRGGHHDWLATNPAEFADAVEVFYQSDFARLAARDNDPDGLYGER